MSYFSPLPLILLCGVVFPFQSSAAVPPDAAGTYTFFSKGTDELRPFLGRGKMTVTSSGAFSGSVTFGGSYSFAGQLSQNGTVNVLLHDQGYGGSRISLRLEYRAPGARFVGAVIARDNRVGGSIMYPLSAELVAPAGRLAGRHTGAFFPSQPVASEPDDPNTPRGTGWMLITVNANGWVLAVGRLGNGQPFLMSSRLRADGAFQFYTGTHILRYRHDNPREAAAYDLSRDVCGVIRLRKGSESAERGGRLRWSESFFKMKAEVQTFTQFEMNLDVEVSRYAPTQADQLGFVFPSETASNGRGKVKVTLESGGLAEVYSTRFALVLQNGLNQVVGLHAPLQQLAFVFSDAQTPGLAGSFQGALQFPNETTPRAFSGVILQKQNIAMGLFQGAARERRLTGTIRMAPATPP